MNLSPRRGRAVQDVIRIGRLPLATLAGIRRGSVDIAPALGSLRRLSAQMPQSKGPIRVWLQRLGGEGISSALEPLAGSQPRCRASAG